MSVFLAKLIAIMPARVWIIAIIVVGGIAGAGAWTGYHRWDAVQDAIAKAGPRAAQERIKTKEQADVRDNKIRALSDCELERDGIVGVSGDADAARAAFQRCVEAATKSKTGNNHVPRAD